MTDNQTETGNVEILPGVQLTPDAQRILNRQLNLKIIWGYWVGKTLSIVLGVAVLFATVIFAFMLPWTGNEIATDVVMGIGLSLMALIGGGLMLLGVRS